MNSFTLGSNAPVGPRGPGGSKFYRFPLSATYEWVLHWRPLNQDGTMPVDLGVVKKGEVVDSLANQGPVYWVLTNEICNGLINKQSKEVIFVLGEKPDMGFRFWFAEVDGEWKVMVVATIPDEDEDRFSSNPSEDSVTSYDVTKVFAQLLECAHRTAYAAGFADGKSEGFKASYAFWHRQS